MRSITLVFFTVLSLSCSAFAQTEADFCVECSTTPAPTSTKNIDSLGDVGKKVDNDFYKTNFLDPELVEKTDSRLLGEMIVARLRNNCDNFRDPSGAKADDKSSEIVMLVNDRNIGNVLKYGFKNQQQTSTTNGSDAKQRRILAESRHVMMGLPYTDKTRELLPKYAMEVFHGKDMGAYDVPFNYGNIMIRFKPEVKKRSTWSPKDSLGMKDALRTQSLRPKNDMKCLRYCEAQIWGDLDASDIESIILPDDYAITDDVKKFGVPVYSYKYTGSKESSYSSDTDAGALRPGDPPAEGAFKDSTIPKVRVSADPIYKPAVKAAPPPKFAMSLVQLKGQVAVEDSAPVRNILNSSIYGQTPTKELIEAYKKKVEQEGSTSSRSDYSSDSSGLLGTEKLRLLSEITGREKTPEVLNLLKSVIDSNADRSIKMAALPGLLHLPWSEQKPILMKILQPPSSSGGSSSSGGYYDSYNENPLIRWAQLMALDHVDDPEIENAIKANPNGADLVENSKSHKFCSEEKLK